MGQYKRYRKSTKDSLGKKFNKLLVLKVVEITDKGTKVKCLCDCGKEAVKYLHNVKSGRTTSCGCVGRAHAIKLLEKANANNPNIIKSKSNDPKLVAAKVAFKRIYASNPNDTLTFEEFLELSQQNCFYCGAEPSNKSAPYAISGSKYSEERQKNTVYIYNGLDRIDNNFGHSKDNVVPCCIRCNKAKHTMTQREFFNLIIKIYKLHNLG